MKTDLNSFNNKTILITGATGLIGRGLIDRILKHNEQGGSISIIATGRNRKNFDAHYPEEVDCLSFVENDVTNPLMIEKEVDYIIHGASITSSMAFVEKPVDVIETTMNGTKNILELAKNKKVKSMVYLSSLEVYGVPPKFEVCEDDYGYIDFTKTRSSYSEGKRMAECLCGAYYSQYDVPVKTVRLTQTIGPGIDYNDGRVFAEFARSVIEKKDIVLNTAGKTVRSYLGINDAVDAILTVLIKGIDGEAYNAANMETAISIADMATFVIKSNPDSGIKVVFNNPDNVDSFGYNPEMKISLDTTKLESLGWKPEENLEVIFSNLIKGMKGNRR